MEGRAGLNEPGRACCQRPPVSPLPAGRAGGAGGEKGGPWEEKWG